MYIFKETRDWWCLIFRTTLFRVYAYVTGLVTPVRIQQRRVNLILGISFSLFVYISDLVFDREVGSSIGLLSYL